MSAKLNIIGRTFERLFVFADAPDRVLPNGRRLRQSWVRCACGSEPFIVLSMTLTATKSRSRSCGCLKEELATKHGHAKAHGKVTRTYRIWSGIVQRCDNLNNHAFDKYGGNGRLMCERWRTSYQNFLADMGECPAGLEIERVDNGKGYEPGNCVWATRAVQTRNTTQNRFFTVRGITACMKDLADHFGIGYQTVRYRLKCGMEPEEAFTRPSSRPQHQPSSGPSQPPLPPSP